MKHYVGIDLGTTNSAICSYDGEEVHLYKSPDQNDVTPSAIFIDKRGNRFVGKRAYDSAPQTPENAATKFKRMMGTSTPIHLRGVNLTLTPEECSAEILRTCFGYLPEDIRNDTDVGTVITVPAAFNQMQKDATMAAAELAGIGKVALMQEPVAAVMSVMRKRKHDGVFLVYDLGGGTLDIAIAESIDGRVSLLAHGGIAMCGGTDFDRLIVDSIVKPWLLSHFKLPDDFTVNARYTKLLRLSHWAAEKAKIELSARDEAIIGMSEPEVRLADECGDDIYLDICITRADLDGLIAEKITDSIQCAQETLRDANLTARDVERVVFVGGPTQYAPLRERVSNELGIAPSTEVNPMTAVAAGAAVFAESIDWASKSRGRKSSRGTLSTTGNLDLSFVYNARTPSGRARFAVKINGSVTDGAEFQVDSQDTGWSSGRTPLRDGASIELILPKNGDNTFKVFVFDASGGPIEIPSNRFVITRTTASVDAIPASSSIGIEVSDKGAPELVYLVRKGDPLPQKGSRRFRAGESVKARSDEALNFKVWEGEITDHVRENRPIGTFSIQGSDFDSGVIPEGAELICDFEVLDSGQIALEVTVPAVSGSFNSDRNFYSRQDSQIDYTTAATRVQTEASEITDRLDDIESKVSDERLLEARRRLDEARAIPENEANPERNKEALDNIQHARQLIAEVRKVNKKSIRQLDLDNCVKFFNEHVRPHARPSEASSFDNLVRTAQRSIDGGGADFENLLRQLRGRNFEILWRQDWFVVEHFKNLTSRPWQFSDRRAFQELFAAGREAIRADNVEDLRAAIGGLYGIRIESSGEGDLEVIANIRRA
ncbi:MAG: Hsp70 family protein [Burkholderiales bacterium]